MSCDTRQVTCATWLMTYDTCHVTHDMWQLLQLPSSYGLGMTLFLRLGGKGRLTSWIIYQGVCRTAPDTPGLLFTENTCLGHSKSKRLIKLFLKLWQADLCYFNPLYPPREQVLLSYSEVLVLLIKYSFLQTFPEANEYNAEEVQITKEVNWMKQNIKSVLKKKIPKNTLQISFVL